MPYAVLERKIKALPESYFEEISAYLDFLQFKENSNKNQKIDPKDTYSEGFFDLFGSDPDFDLEEPQELPIEIRKEL